MLQCGSHPSPKHKSTDSPLVLFLLSLQISSQPHFHLPKFSPLDMVQLKRHLLHEAFHDSRPQMFFPVLELLVCPSLGPPTASLTVAEAHTPHEPAGLYPRQGHISDLWGIHGAPHDRCTWQVVQKHLSNAMINGLMNKCHPTYQSPEAFEYLHTNYGSVKEPA